MNFDVGDLVRSIVIGQSVAMSILTTIYVWLSIRWRNLRPGAVIGLIAMGISHIAASFFVVVIMAERINMNVVVDYHTYSAIFYVVFGNLGVTLLTAHVIFHHDSLREKIMGWFGHNQSP